MTNYLRWYSPKASDSHYEDLTYKDGPVFEDNLNEQLDSGIVIINRSPKKNFEPFDIVDVYNSSFSTKTMLIDNVVENQVCFEPDLYDYTINLMSKTKELERIVLPNFSVTRLIYDDGTPGPAKTLKQVIQSLLTDYCPKYFINGSFTRIYRLEDDSRLDIDCPDMQMSRPSLREAIDRILSVIHCICRLDANNIIRLVDINQRNNAVQFDGQLNYVHENQSSGDYASTLDNIYNNVVPSSVIEDIDKYADVTEYIGFRDADNGVVSEDNLFIQTKFPIYNIKKVVMYITSGTSSNPGYVFKLDITERIVEQQEFVKLPYGAVIQGIVTYPAQTNCAYYIRGDNQIVNWSNSYKQLGITETVLENMMNSVISEKNIVSGGWGGSVVHKPRQSCSFEITYTPQVDSIRMKSGKFLPEAHENNEIIDNPTESFVDIYQQGALFNQKVNRLGNRARIITGRYPIDKLNMMPKLGDYMEDFVVMNTEIQYYDGFAVFKGVLTENFVNINYFTGINARRRSWQIVGAHEAFDKQLICKFYCEFSFTAWNNSSDNEYTVFQSDEIDSESGKNLIKLLADVVMSDNDYKISGVFAVNQYMRNEPLGINFHDLECQSFISGNSIVFTCGMLDNFQSAVPSLVEYQNENAHFTGTRNNLEAGGYVEEYNKYVDDYGRCNKVSLVFVTGYGIQTGMSYWANSISNVISMQDDSRINYSSLQKTSGSHIPYFYLYQGYKPRVTWLNKNENNISVFEDNESPFSIDFYNTKDSRERLNFNVQFEYCSDTKDIIFTKEFLKRKKLIATKTYDLEDYEVYASPDIYRYGDEYLQGNSQLTSGNIYISLIELDGSHYCAGFLFNNVGNVDGYKSLVLVDKTTKKVIIALNNFDIHGRSFYMNLLQNRDRKNYKSYNMKEWY